jgi:site-specific DNA recombinase
MRAALYLRSSKDRSDVSLSAQRHELEKLAASRSLPIANSYEDAVESGSTDDRPAFIELVRAIKDPGRGWTHLLVYDTSRLARRRYIAQALKHEAKKRGVVILYARMPADMDPVAELVLESVFEAMDEAHSLMSREKGLAGMAQNVRQGWRAGGRAPFGYQLEHHATGAVREGKPVTKTKLITNEKAAPIREYLKARATGTPRVIAGAKLKMSPTSLIGIEWNALTYAGHQVWNRHAAEGTGTKRRPRDQWQITRDTHTALISDAEAESILSQLETSPIGEAVRRAKASVSEHLLTGLLFADDGQMWVGHGRYYRLRKKGGRLVKSALIDAAVLKQVRLDLGSDRFLSRLLEAAKLSRELNNPAAAIDDRIKQLEREKNKAAELALTSDSNTFLAIIADRTKQIDALRREATAVRADNSLSLHLANLTVDKFRDLLADRDPARMVQTLVERIILEPDLSCKLNYKVVPGKAAWRCVASPKVCDTSPPALSRQIIIEAA